MVGSAVDFDIMAQTAMGLWSHVYVLGREHFESWPYVRNRVVAGPLNVFSVLSGFEFTVDGSDLELDNLFFSRTAAG